jgi:hypothetical protein
MSTVVQIAIYVAVLAVGWVGYVVWRVRRDRKKPSGSATADAYEGNLVIPVAASRRHGLLSGHRGIEYHNGSGAHSAPHHGPGGFDGHGSFGGVSGDRH